MYEEILRGSNDPIVIEIDDEGIDFSEYPRVTAVLSQKNLVCKHWIKEDMEFEDNFIILPLSEEDTMELPLGLVTLDIKGINNRMIDFVDLVKFKVVDRPNKDRMADAE